jgi:gluconolactonase
MSSSLPALLRLTGLVASLCCLPLLQAEAPKTSVDAPYRKPVGPVPFPTHGSIERLSPGLDVLLAPDARMELLAGGFNWSEGPTWLPRENALVFSDVPENRIFRWSDRDGLTVYLEPSGYTGHDLNHAEQGSNGLTTDQFGRLVICQHGDRRIVRLAGRKGEIGRFDTIVDRVGGRHFNSPNDLCYSSNGDLYFTDPPYGLRDGNKSALKDLMFNGVYLLRAKTLFNQSPEPILVASELTFPNGVALSPDGKTLYINVSDPERPVIMAYPVLPDGLLGKGRVLFDTAPLMAKGRKGLPDGLKVDVDGNLWATGPGGVLVISPMGRHLGTLLTGEATGNCGWGDDGSTLYITADAYLLRIRTLTKGYSPWAK